MSTNNNRTHYKTSSLNLSIFLVSKGLQLADIENQTNSTRSIFVFVDSPQREHLVHLFNFAAEDEKETLVDARKILMAGKMLKEKLYQEKG